MERALVLIKPDGVERSLIGKVIAQFEEAGLKVTALKMLNASDEQVQKHYTDDESWLVSVGKKTKQSYLDKGIEVKETEREIGLRVRSFLVNEITRSPIVAIVLEGNACAEVARKIAGSTEPKKADPYTIRGRYANDSYSLADKKQRSVRNIVHVSEDSTIAEKEIKVWFSDKEICKCERADEGALYG
jgi:nucleoside-diphosphate kinase